MYVTSYPQMYNAFHHWISLYFFVNLMEKKPPLNLYGLLTIFHQLFAKFLMNRLYLDVSDVMHANEDAIYGNCGLHINFRNFLLLTFCFTIKMDHFK